MDNIEVTEEMVWAAVNTWDDWFTAELFHNGRMRNNKERAMKESILAALRARFV
jgi:hypothetical protein